MLTIEKYHSYQEAQVLLQRIKHNDEGALLEAAYSEHPSLRRAAVSHADTPADGLYHLCTQVVEKDQKLILAGRKDLPEAAVTYLVARNRPGDAPADNEIDVVLACNPVLDLRHTEILIQNCSPVNAGVYIAIAGREDATSRHIEEMIRLGGWMVGRYILGDDRLDPSALYRLPYHPSYASIVESWWKDLPEWEEIESIMRNWIGTVGALKEAAGLVRR